jgi:peptide chain release factor 1
MSRRLLFTLTKKDFKVDYFSGSGAGGQHRNKHQNCVRLRHPASGAIAVGQSHRDRKSNMREAKRNLVNNGKFKMWHTRKCHELLTGKTLDERVDEAMQSENLKVEVQDEEGRWIKI